MAVLSSQDWQTFQEVYGFIGNSLLKPMTQTPTFGINPIFWESFPELLNSDFAVSVATCRRYAREASKLEASDAVNRAAVEYTRLFVGPPSPAAPPWETMYRDGATSVGFGEATFEMRQLLRDGGLELCGKNNQYEDHMGLELLYLSEMCGRYKNLHPVDSEVAQMKNFIEAHPLKWIVNFCDKVEIAYPEGYFVGLLKLAKSTLSWQRELLSQ